MIVHSILMVASVAALMGALWLGSEAAKVMIEDINSHDAEWKDIGAHVVILSGVICTVITSLYAVICTVF